MKPWLLCVIGCIVSITGLAYPPRQVHFEQIHQGEDAQISLAFSPSINMGKHDFSFYFFMQDLLDQEPIVLELSTTNSQVRQDFGNFISYCFELLEDQSTKFAGFLSISHGYDSLLKDLITPYQSFLLKEQQAVFQKKDSIAFAYEPFYQLKLAYHIPVMQVQNDADLKRMWIHSLIQIMATVRLKDKVSKILPKNIGEKDRARFFPTHTVSCSFVAKNLEELISEKSPLSQVFQEIFDIKAKGFSPAEFSHALTTLRRKIKNFSIFKIKPSFVANYWSSLLAYKSDYPSLAHVAIKGLQQIDSITLQDVHEELSQAFCSRLRSIKFCAPTEQDKNKISNLLQEQSFDQIKCHPNLLDDKKSGPFSKLIFLDEEKQQLLTVVENVAKAGPIQLGFMLGDLERKRTDLLHIHPLKSMEFLLLNEQARPYLEDILNSFLKCRSFLKDFEKRMKQEHKDGNLMPYLPEFCTIMNGNLKEIRMYVFKEDFKGLIYYLMDLKKPGHTNHR